MGQQLGVAFLTFAVVLVTVASAAITRFLPPGRYRFGAFGLLLLWSAGAAWLSASGILGSSSRWPPGLGLLVVPTIAIVMFAARSYAGAVAAASFPVAVLVGAQTLRIVVEVFIDRLHHAGALATIMTLPGGNVDVLVGVTAPLVAVLYATRRVRAWVVLAWNVVGLLSLANVVLRAALSSPAIGLVRTEVPNVALGSLPFALIPTLLVPLALVLHVLAIRALRAEMRDDAGAPAFVSTRPAISLRHQAR